MAKQLVNPVERHAEKAVLGVAILLLILVLIKYVVFPPNQIELAGEWVSPGTIDQKLAERADAVRDRIRRAQFEEETTDELYEVFLEALDPYKSGELPLSLPVGVSVGLEVPLIDAAEATVGHAELATVVRLEKPSVTHGRSTYTEVDAYGQERRPEANWVTISALFDVKAQMAEQRLQYGPTRKEVVFGAPQLQRRARRDDGSWSDEDWQDVDPHMQVESPREPQIRLEQEGQHLVADSQVLAAVDDFYNDLSYSKLQLDLLRPMPPEIVNGTKWTFPIIAPVNYREVLMMDDQYQFPDQPPSSDPPDRYGGLEGKVVTRVADTLAQRIAAEFAEAQRLLSSANKNTSENEAVRAWNILNELAKNKEAKPADRTRAEKMRERADIVRATIQRRHWRGPTRVTEQSDDEVAREPRPIQQIWVHDAAPRSVESGKVYQYRLRSRVFNRLAAQPDKFRDPYDAAKVFIAGEWSEPVEVAVEPSTLFFAIGEDEHRNRISLDFFMWFEGVWIKARNKFGVGDRLAFEKICQVPSTDPEEVADRLKVPFSANATVLDIDFDRAYRERKKGAGRSGIKFSDASTACCVVLADSQGKLYERFVPTDKSDPGKRAVDLKLWKVPSP